MHGNMTRTFGFLALTAILLAGCGAKGKQWSYNNKVEGVAKIDGVPLAGVLVAFSPDDPQYQGPLSHGYTDENGHFELKADNRKAGAVVAKHLVTVLPGRGADPQAGEAQGKEAALAKAKQKNPPVPTCYKIAKDTPLVVDVTADKHTYDLDLSQNAGPRPAKRQ
jgi:hypothetical protein